MAAGKRAAPRPTWPRRVLVLVPAVLALVVMGFVVAGPGRQRIELVPPAGSQPAMVGPLQACAREIEAGATTLRVARIGVGHWQAHVQARTDLLSGENTAAESDAIWSRTRLAGPTDLRRFDHADRAYRRSATPDCTGGATGRGVEHRTMVRACSERAQLTARAVAASRTAIGDWQAHLANMAAFDNHEFGVEHAQRMWVRAWSTAPADINAFHDAVRRLRHAPACSAT